MRKYEARYYDLHDSPKPRSRGFTDNDHNCERNVGGRVYSREYAKAQIIDRRSGAVIVTIKRTRNGVSEHYGDR